MTELKHLSNVVRKDIGMISLSESETYETALHQILEYYKNAGVNVDEKGEHLYIFANDESMLFSESNWLLSIDNKIIYSDIVALNNAHSFYENDGIRYFFIQPSPIICIILMYTQRMEKMRYLSTCAISK